MEALRATRCCAWISFCKRQSLRDKRVRFAGREPASGVAVRYKVLHALQEQRLLNDAFQME